MGENNNRWNWEVTGFEPNKSSSSEDNRTRLRGYSIPLASKVHSLKEKVQLAKGDYVGLRQEAIDLQEYSNAKLERVTRYLGVLADKTRRLDQHALETEARISPLINEKKRLFNDLLTTKGNVKVFCRARPLFEDEGPSIIEFPDNCTVRVNTGDDTLSNPKKEFEFDRVYGPHVGQASLFSDVQPFMQSALDGSNVSVFAYGQTNAGKTYTMEGSNQERGLYARCFEELIDLANSDSTSTSQFSFSVSVFELYNEQIRDLLPGCQSNLPKINMGLRESVIELSQEKVDNPSEFLRILKSALQSRGNDKSKSNVTHLIVSVHICYNNTITGESVNSKLSLVDLAGSEGLTVEDDNGDHVTDLLHVTNSISALGDVLSSLTSKKDTVPYENSFLTRILSDSLGGSSKTLMIVNICPSARNLSEIMSCLNYAARARNTVPSLGNRDTIKKWRDLANDARKEVLEKERETQRLKQEVTGLKQALKEANDQCVLLYNEVQRAWRVSFTLQSDLKSETTMVADKHNVEKEQNSQLRNQITQLSQLEQEQKLQVQQQDSTIQNLQSKVKDLESQLSEALKSDTTRSADPLESHPRTAGSTVDSSAVTKKLEEELKKRDALIERLHEENEKLFDRLTEKSNAGSTQVSSPSSKASPTVQSADFDRKNSVGALPSSVDKNDGAITVVKSSSEIVKTTPAGEYLTAALNDFDPEQYEGLAAIADGANKLLMLVLAAVIKAGASREHEILAEIRDAVFSFIRKMEPRRVMDTMLVSRVRILYIRSLLARSPELQSIKVSPVERFLEKPYTSRTRSSSGSSSPGRSPVRYYEEQVHGFKVNLKPDKKSKLVSVVSRIRGHDQDTGRQQVTGGKLREIQDDAKSFAIGNKPLAALFVHTPAGELQRQIRSWLAESFEFLSVTADDASGGTTGQLELLSTAIMDGWMAGVGAAVPPHTDALGQLLSDYAKRVYTSQMQHLKDIAGTLASEEAEDAGQVAKLRSALESVDHKRRKILQQMRSDAALFTLEEGSSPVQNPSTAAEEARLASLISLDAILKQVKEITRQASVHVLSKSKKKALLESLEELTERMPSLLDVDHPCAQREIATARQLVETIPEQEDSLQEEKRHSLDSNVNRFFLSSKSPEKIRKPNLLHLHSCGQTISSAPNPLGSGHSWNSLAALCWIHRAKMDTNLVEMFRAGLNWVTMALDAPSARVVLFGVRIQWHIFVEVLLGFVIVILLSQKSYKPPKRPLTEQEIDELCDEWVPEPLIPPITEDMRHEPPVLESAAGPHTTVNGKDVVNFASANYLGLIGHEKLLESCTSALEKYGVGSCGPRGFYGTIDVHLDCETRISKFLSTPDTILYSYGLSTMFSTIPCFCKKGDIIVADEGVHWGIQNGLQLSRSTIVYFKHNDMDSLRSTLEKIMTKNKRSKNLRRYIVAEAVYQNSGQIAPLDEIVKLKEKYKFRVILDESNSFGVLGRSGRGLAEHHGVPIEKIDVVTAAMGHALATEGGFCTGNARIIDYQRLSSSGYVFSASLPPYLASAAITAIDVIDQNPELLVKMKQHIALLWKGLKDIKGMSLASDPESPIVFLKLENSSGSTKEDLLLLEKMADRALKEDSLLVVSSKKSFLDKCRLPVGIKLLVSAGHSESDLVKVSESLKRLASELLL